MDGAAVLCCYVCVCADDGEDRSAENDTSSPVKQVRCSNLIMISNTLTRQALTQSAHIWFTSFPLNLYPLQKMVFIFRFLKHLVHLVVVSLIYKLFSSLGPKKCPNKVKNYLYYCHLGDTFHRHRFLYCINCILYYIPTLTQPLNLPITQNFLHFIFSKKTSLSMIYNFFFLIRTKKCPHKEKDFGYCHLFEDIL